MTATTIRLTAPAEDLVSWTPAGNVLVLDGVEAIIEQVDMERTTLALAKLPKRVRHLLAAMLLHDDGPQLSAVTTTIARRLTAEHTLREALAIHLTQAQAASVAEELTRGMPDPCETCAGHGVTDYGHSTEDCGGAL